MNGISQDPALAAQTFLEFLIEGDFPKMGVATLFVLCANGLDVNGLRFLEEIRVRIDRNDPVIGAENSIVLAGAITSWIADRRNRFGTNQSIEDRFQALRDWANTIGE